MIFFFNTNTGLPKTDPWHLAGKIRSIALTILNLGTSRTWVVSLTSHFLYTSEREPPPPSPTVLANGWNPQPVLTLQRETNTFTCQNLVQYMPYSLDDTDHLV